MFWGIILSKKDLGDAISLTDGYRKEYFMNAKI